MTYLSHADLGGQPGHGRVTPEPEGELFHAAWEPRALALTLAMGATGSWNIDMSRSARETVPDYRELSYYELWIAALQKLLQERDLVKADEIAAGHALHAPRPGGAGARRRRSRTRAREGLADRARRHATRALCGRPDAFGRMPARCRTTRGCPAMCAASAA